MNAGLYFFFVFLYLFLTIIMMFLWKIKDILELMQIEQKFMINDSIRTNKKLMEFFDLYK